MRRIATGAVLAVLVAASGAQAAGLKVSGGTATHVEMCGKPHRAQLFDPGAPATLRGPGRLVLSVCHDGKWGGRKLLGSHRAMVAENAGDFRVRAIRRGKRKRAFLRFGVGEIVDAPLRVTVRNTNTTAVSCMADGGERTLHGHLTAPRSVLSRPDPAVTLFVHGFAVHEPFWRFRAVPGYDTTMKLAEAGHASVTIDRAGYGTSRVPADGNTTCIGSQADMAHQVVEALKSGAYTIDANTPVSFERAALVGHSVGGLIAELAGATYPGIDGIGIVSYADQGQTPLAISELGDQSLRCGSGGDAATPGFALFTATDQAFGAAFLNAPTDPAVVAAATADHVPEPCGDVLSATATLLTSNTIGSSLEGPVLLLSGEDDALFTPAGVRLQRERLGGTNDTVTMELVPETGHAITLGQSAPTVVDALESWLTTNGF
jgi:pimeloyl-ACP methyl ester carboxylesterase